MPDYKKLYAYLVGEIDDALTMMDTGDLMLYSQVKAKLQAALLEAEERMISDQENP